MNPIAQLLSPALFWDVDISRLDWQKHRLLIVERVIERGTFKAFKEVEDYYGKEEMTNIVKQLPYLNKKDAAFVNIYFNIPLNELKCSARIQ